MKLLTQISGTVVGALKATFLLETLRLRKIQVNLTFVMTDNVVNRAMRKLTHDHFMRHPQLKG